MSAKDLALNLLIKAKDTASGVVRTFKKEVEDSGRAAEELDQSLEQTNRGIESTGKEFSKTGEEARDFRAKVDEARTSTERLTGDTRGSKFWQRWSKGSKGASRDTQKFKQDLNEIPAAARNAEGGIGSLTKKLIALGGTYLGINAIKNAIMGLINTGSRFEDMSVQINTLMGSIEEGEKAIAWIKEFAKTTPTDIEGVTRGFIRLKAFGIDPMNGSYQAIIDQTSKLGFSQEKMEGIILALGQAWTKQKLQGEEALQLIERGVPVWDLLAEATGRAAVELQDMASNGELGRKEIELLMKAMGEQSKGAAAEAMKTWTGLVSNLKDMWLNFVNDISESGFLDYMKEQLQAVLDQIKKLAEDGTLKRWAKEISDGLIKVANGFKSVIQFTIEWGTQLGYLVAALAVGKLVSFSKAVWDVAKATKAAAFGTAAMTTATSGMGTAAAAAGKGWGWLAGAAKGLKAVAGWVVAGGRLLTGVGLLAAAVKLVADRWHESEQAANKAHAAMQQRSIDAVNEQHKQLEFMNTQLKTEEELGRISRQGYEAYLQRLQGAQAYWQARVAEEQAEIEQGRQRQLQMEEAKAQLETYIEAETRLKQQITDVNALKSQELSLGVAGAQQHTQQTETKIAELGEIGALQQQLNEQRKEQLTAEQDAFKALGLNMEEVTGQITEQGQAAVSAFETIVESGKYSSEQIQEAFNAALGKARTKADVEALIEVLDKAGKSGDLAGKLLRSSMEDARQKLKQLESNAKGAADKVGDVGKEAKGAKSDLDELGEAMEDSAKKGKGGMESLAKEIRELIQVVRDLAKEFREAGQEADELRKKTEAAKKAAKDSSTEDDSEGKGRRPVSPAESVAHRLGREDEDLERAVWAVINQGKMKDVIGTMMNPNEYAQLLEKRARSYLAKQRAEQDMRETDRTAEDVLREIANARRLH
ncbi:tape measure protein [Marinobacterium sp. MBR-109]|jgi:tape measure domain-containing protein|uniref:tape measure protein n=1 Tax=Marinobacterium sp. MBR-109 TaxID=3156462 RepID=UPI003398FE7E